MLKLRAIRVTWMTALVICAASAALAQDITGTWQGTVQDPGQQRRLLFKITADNGTLRVALYSIDRGPQPYAGTATVTGTNVSILLPSLNGTFGGKLSADGSEIAGTYAAQGAAAVPLTVKHVGADAAWEIPAVPAALKPMAADANPAFEVATIKPSKPGTPGQGIVVRGRQFSTLNTPLSLLIAFAYGLHPRQIAEAAPWMDQDQYDILAQPDADGVPNEKQLRTMMQKLIADRFKLTFHLEKRELAVYTITVADKTKAASALTPNVGNPNGLPGLGFSRPGALRALNAKISDFANLLQTVVMDRPVVDQTTLPERYDFQFNWTPDQSQFGGRGPAPSDDPSAPPGIFTAMQEQLGLKLESTRAPVDVLVIDHVEKPTAD